MAFSTRNPRHDQTTFFARNARFIIPACWLFAAAMRLVDAVRTDATSAWLGVAGFAGVAVLNYVCFRQLHLKRLKDARRDGTD
jgi:hypothetical protein